MAAIANEEMETEIEKRQRTVVTPSRLTPPRLFI